MESRQGKPLSVTAGMDVDFAREKMAVFGQAWTWLRDHFFDAKFRLPRTRITDAAGQDMEMRPRPVDVPVVRPVGESDTGHDTQLDAAVRELAAQIGVRAR